MTLQYRIRFALALSATLAIASVASAGGGSINVDNDVPTVGHEKGDLTLSVQFNSFPTQDVVQSTMNKIEAARSFLCDATDGQIRIREVTFSIGGYGESDADIWITDAGDRAYNDGALGFKGQIVLFQNECLEPGCMRQEINWGRGIFGWEPFTLAHELGHYVLGLGDSYDEQRRSNSGCGVGPSFETADLTDVDNSIMQGRGAFCVNAANDTHSDVDPLHWVAQPCREGTNDCDVFAATGFTTCRPPPQTELAVETNYDPVLGDFGPAECPDPLPAHYVQLTADLNAGDAFWMWTCGDGMANGWEECDGVVSAPCEGVDTGFNPIGDAACVICQWDTSTCTNNPCGNGSWDPALGEQCDPTDAANNTSTCTDVTGFQYATNPAVGCRADCSWDLQPCETNLFLCNNGVIDAPIPDPFNPGSFVGGEQCDGGNLGGATCQTEGFDAGTLGCYANCYFNYGGCTRELTCGNGSIDPGEECDPSDPTAPPLPTCGALGYLDEVGLPPTCDAQCRIDSSECIWPGTVRFDPAGFDTALATSIPNGYAALDVYDSLGLTGGLVAETQYVTRESIHRLHTYISRVNPVDWLLIFAVDEGEYAGGSDGEFLEIARFNLRFDAPVAPATLVEINGVSVDIEGRSTEPGPVYPTLVLGGDTDTFVPWGSSTNGAEGQHQRTGAFAETAGGITAPELELELLLGNLQMDTWNIENGDLSLTSRFHVGTNQGTRVLSEEGCVDTDLPNSCTPQRGVCNSPGLCRVSWRNGRYEATDQTATQLKENLLAEATEVPGVADWPLAGRIMAARYRRPVPEHPQVCSFGDTIASPLMDCRMSADCGVDDEGVAGTCVSNENVFALQVREDPAALPDEDCDDPAKPVVYPQGDAAEVVAELGLPANLLVVMDISGSMGEPVGAISALTRIELARSATMTLVDQLTDSGRQLGLVTFGGQTPVAPARPRDGDGPYNTDVPVQLAPVGTGGVSRDDWQIAVNGIEPVDPLEGTAICAGLEEGRAELEVRGGGTMGVLLMTDGENNRPYGDCASGHLPTNPFDWQTGADATACMTDWMCDDTPNSCVGSCNPEMAANQFTINDGDRIPVVLVPTGGDAAGQQAVAMAAATNGMVIEAPDADALPSAYFEAETHFRGETPVLTRRPSVAFDRELPEMTPLEVEAGAERLNVHVSLRAPPIGSPDPSSYEWSPAVFLVDPTNSIVMTSEDPVPPGAQLIVDPNYILMKWDNPMPGTWHIGIIKTDSSLPDVLSYVTAQVENPDPNCAAQATPGISDGTEPIRVEAQAFYGEPLGSGVTFTGEVRVPGGAPIALDFIPGDRGVAVAEFDPADFTTQGLYEIIVKCDVAGDAAHPMGESIFGAVEPPQGVVTPFVREARAAFYTFSGPPPGLPPGLDLPTQDADGDGILNQDEPAGDLDRDGVPNNLDSNADGDDAPDSIDLDPFDPGVGTPPSTSGCTPVITVVDGETITRLNKSPSPTPVDASATCDGAPTELTGRIVSVGGAPVFGGTFDGTSPTLPLGTVVIRWTATGDGGIVVQQDQTVVVVQLDGPAACDSSLTVVEGTPLPDYLSRPDSAGYCMFGYDSFDLIIGGPVPDVLSGGSFSDEIVGNAGGDTLLGGPDPDQLTLSFGGVAFGGDGPDSLFVILGDSTLYGGNGADAILGGPGDDDITPGAGPDAVEAGAGDDIVRINDTCEVLPGEALDGGPGFDTLYTPVPVSTLLSMNVVVASFEAIVVTGGDDSYKAECVCAGEVCGDSIDNDCDGTVDEGAAAEICYDFLDNTCDGLVDEGCPGGPCGSETATVDEHVVSGRAAANACGGTELFFDDFAAGLGQWTETGEGDWNTESLHSATGYDAGGSGSPAAHADNCDTTCTLTMADAIDLTAVSGATLEFQRFVDSSLESDDYLRVEVYDGSSWVTAYSWTAGSGADNTWHIEVLDLSAYLGVTDFRVRLVTSVDSYYEHVHIDDLRVTGSGASTCYTAVGSGEDLGSDGTASITLYESSPGVWSQSCDTGACVPTADACDGIDNDCDSAIDEGCLGCLTCNPDDFCGTDLTDFCGGQLDCSCAAGDTCTSTTPGVPGSCCTPLQCLPGFCGFDVLDGCGGLQDCTANCGAGTYCPAVTAGTVVACVLCGLEICGDGLDNDCDGAVDDGCGVCVEYTDTVDGHVTAGRAEGAGCATGEVFADAFTDSSQWTESGEGDWTIESRHSTSGYPDSGSGSPVLGADNCDTSCTMTQAAPIDLSTVSSATLDFLRFVDSELDSTDYLRVEAFDGSAWNTIASWAGGSGDDDTWHEESVDLAAYVGTGDFRVRFVTRVSSLAEHVQIDDVRITTGGGGCSDYLAVGSNDSLGSDLDATVVLAEQPVGYFTVAACP